MKDNETLIGWEYNPKSYELLIESEDYILIEKFMGNPIPENYVEGTRVVVSWNHLMPVVEKIHKSNPRAFKIDLFDGPLSPLAKLYIHSSIEEVYKAVLEFIKWYNTQKP